jgi:hypothetical protein
LPGQSRAGLLAGDIRLGSNPQLAFWAPVALSTAASRALGAGVPTWFVRDGIVRHVPGHDQDFLYLRMPLAGNFEVTGEISGFGLQQVHVLYGGVMVAVALDGKTIEVSQTGRHVRKIEVDPPLGEPKAWQGFRLAVKDSVYAFAVGGRTLPEERLPEAPDPWLALHQEAAGNGAIRNLSITGKPTIPERIDLTRGADLEGWHADYYDEPLSGPLVNWSRRGEEIVGRGYAAALQTSANWQRPGSFNAANAALAYAIGIPGSDHESLLQYQRPLLEDGAIHYEFYYVPGKTMVHPALDRLVLLLEPDGVKVHWLTNTPHERTGLSPGNAKSEPSHRVGPERLPLNANDWNRITMRLDGDTLTLSLNDIPVFKRPLEPTNQRTFGLFHYADQTEARARQVIYEGKWPRSLPEPSELFRPRSQGRP